MPSEMRSAKCAKVSFTVLSYNRTHASVMQVPETAVQKLHAFYRIFKDIMKIV